MVNRDEYVANLKGQLDRWSDQMASWESFAHRARHGTKTKLRKQIGILRSRLDDAIFRFELVQSASADAWLDIKLGADEARSKMEQALEKARAHFKDI